MFTTRIIALFFLIEIVCATFSNNIVVFNFYLNQNYIAKTLCENRDKPQMHCSGKCQLQKKINEETNKDKQTSEQKNGIGNEVLSSKTFFASLIIPANLFCKKTYFLNNTGTPVDRTLQFFHPPQRLFV